MRPLLPILVILCAWVLGCRKPCERDLPPPALPAPLQLASDSACINVPNVITPNADGINDRLYIAFTNITEAMITLTDTSGTVLFATNEHWNSVEFDAFPLPTANNRPTRINVRVEALSTSGVTLEGFTPVYIVTNPVVQCFAAGGEILTGDQLDPRRCNLRYPSNDSFCFQ